MTILEEEHIQVENKSKTMRLEVSEEIKRGDQYERNLQVVIEKELKTIEQNKKLMKEIKKLEKIMEDKDNVYEDEIKEFSVRNEKQEEWVKMKEKIQEHLLKIIEKQKAEIINLKLDLKNIINEEKLEEENETNKEKEESLTVLKSCNEGPLDGIELNVEMKYNQEQVILAVSMSHKKVPVEYRQAEEQQQDFGQLPDVEINQVNKIGQSTDTSSEQQDIRQLSDSNSIQVKESRQTKLSHSDIKQVKEIKQLTDTSSEQQDIRQLSDRNIDQIKEIRQLPEKSSEQQEIRQLSENKNGGITNRIGGLEANNMSVDNRHGGMHRTTDRDQGEGDAWNTSREVCLQGMEKRLFPVDKKPGGREGKDRGGEDR
jgi:hypothetical protein